MPEPVNPNPTPGADPANPNPNPAPGATDPKNPGSGTGNEFDPTKLSDEQLARVLEDQRLWKTPRLTELREAQTKLKTIEAEKEKADREALAKKGEWETLAKQEQEKAAKAEAKYADAITNSAIMAEAAKKGITDLDAASKLIDRSKITIDDDGNVKGVAEAVDALVKEKTYLVGGVAQPNVGSPTNPANPGATGQFKLSQLQDPAFYAANHAAIQKALATPGGIIDDLAPMGGR